MIGTFCLLKQNGCVNHQILFILTQNHMIKRNIQFPFESTLYQIIFCLVMGVKSGPPNIGFLNNFLNNLFKPFSYRRNVTLQDEDARLTINDSEEMALELAALGFMLSLHLKKPQNIARGLLDVKLDKASALAGTAIIASF